MAIFINFLLVAVGGAVGSTLRYFLTLLFEGRVWPVGTFSANIVGTFIIGIVVELVAIKTDMPPEVRLLFATGFCGGLTTLSSLVFETDRFLIDRQFLIAAAYGIGTLVLAFIALRGGMGLARLIFREVQ